MSGRRHHIVDVYFTLDRDNQWVDVVNFTMSGRRHHIVDVYFTLDKDNQWVDVVIIL